MDSEREEGFYWVRYLGDWFPAIYNGGMRPGWYIGGYSSTFRESEFQVIGPRLYPPDQQFGAGTNVSTMGQVLTIAS